MGVARDDSNQSATSNRDLEDLRAETIERLAVVFLVVFFGVLILTADQTSPPRPLKWLVLAPLLAAVGATRLRSHGLVKASVATIGCLAFSIGMAVVVFPGEQFIYTLGLLVFVAGLLLGDTAALGTCALSSVFSVFWLPQRTLVVGEPVVSTVLLVIWLAAALSWLTERSTRTTLDWAWSSYLLAVQRTEELREQRGELGRVAKSLTETCIQLEEMNRELERARRVAEEARHLKTEFAATISHELRTPLNLVIGFSEMMLRDPDALAGDDLPSRYLSALTAVHRNASHISRLIDDILDLSQIEAHRMALTKTWIPLTSIVDDAVSTIASLYDHLGLTLAVEISDDLPPLHVDANRMRQVLINLLSNAARYTDQGGVTIRAQRAGHDVRIGVSDTGEGIAPEDIPYVFQEFRQVGPRSRRRGGSGLGLAVCKAFVEMHGGWISVESTIGRGSTFYVNLPLSTNVVTEPANLASGPASTDVRTVIVLDRDPDAVRPFRRYLDGYQVAWAGSIENLTLLAARQPTHAVLITDKSLAESIRNASPFCGPLQNVPVFSCPLNTPQTIAESLGANEYLVKPVSHDRLKTALRHWAKDARDVLIVEDEAEMSDLLSSMVRSVSRRYQVRQAADGERALEMVNQRRPDAILLDLLMPSLSGYEVIQAVRQDPTLRDLPVIVVSAKGTMEEVMRTSALMLSRNGGLSVGDLMLCLRSSLDALLRPVHPNTGQVQSAGFFG